MGEGSLARWLAFTLSCLAGCGSHEHDSVRALVVAAPTALVVDDNAGALLPRQIVKIAFHQGLVWIQGEKPSNGWDSEVRSTLVTLDPSSGHITEQLADETILHLHRTLDDQLWVLSTRNFEAHLWKDVHGKLELMFTLDALVSDALALSDWQGSPVVLRSNEIFFVNESGKLWRTRLERELTFPRRPARSVSFAVASDRIVYVGVNRGDAGALYSIHLDTGSVLGLERHDRKALRCEGTFDSRCDPVTAVINDPDEPTCVLASIGFSHDGSEHGRVISICNDGIRERHFPGAERPPPPARSKACLMNPFPSPTCAAEDAAIWAHTNGLGTAIHDLVRTRAGFWMTTSDALFHVQSGKPTRVEPPRFTRLGPTFVGLTNGLLLMMSDTSQPGLTRGYRAHLAATSLENDGDDIARYPALRNLSR